MEPSQRGWRDGWGAESSVKGTEVAEVQTAGAQHTWKAHVVEGGQGGPGCAWWVWSKTVEVEDESRHWYFVLRVMG